VVSGDNWSYKSCKVPVKSSPSKNQHPIYTKSGGKVTRRTQKKPLDFGGNPGCYITVRWRAVPYSAREGALSVV